MKQLKFRVSQSSTNAPEVMEIKNTFGSIQWVRDLNGHYRGLGNFEGYDIHCPQDLVNYTNNLDIPFTLKLRKMSDTEIEMASVTTGFSTEDDLLTNIFVEVYFKKQR